MVTIVNRSMNQKRSGHALIIHGATWEFFLGSLKVKLHGILVCVKHWTLKSEDSDKAHLAANLNINGPTSPNLGLTFEVERWPHRSHYWVFTDQEN